MNDVDRAPIDQLVARIEARADRRGWDAPPAAYVIYDAADLAAHSRYQRLLGQYGTPVQAGGYMAQPMLPATMMEGGAAHAVFRFARSLLTDRPEVAALLGMLRSPAFHGVAVSYEAWMRTNAQTTDEAVSYADQVGSQEIRGVNAITVDGSEYAIVRVRGESPVTLTEDNLDADSGGSVPEALRVLVARIADQPIPAGGVISIPRNWPRR